MITVITSRKTKADSCCSSCGEGKPCCGSKPSRFSPEPSGLLLPRRELLLPGRYNPMRSLLTGPSEIELPGNVRRPWLPAMMPVLDMSGCDCCDPGIGGCCLEEERPLLLTATISGACCANLNQDVLLQSRGTPVYSNGFVEPVEDFIRNCDGNHIGAFGIILRCAEASSNGSGGSWFLHWGVCPIVFPEVVYPIRLLSCNPMTFAPVVVDIRSGSLCCATQGTAVVAIAA
jgi:hypothetical protein